MKKFIKLIVVCVFLLYVVGCGMIDYSDGDRAGVVTKLSHKGIFCKTWEGELLMGGLMQGSNDVTIGTNQFYFSVKDENVIKQIQEKMITGEHVVLTYKQTMFRFPFSCIQQTNYLITGVK